MYWNFKAKILIAMIALISLTSPLAFGEYVCGDANGDNAVNVSDAVWIINYVFVSGNPPIPLCLGNANGDGSLNVSDAVFIINYVFISGQAPDPTCCDSYCPSTVIDIDGNAYQTVLIGDQCWMMENLKVTHYRNGDPIPNVTDDTDWKNQSDGAYCEYENNPDNVETYGLLYNSYAAEDSRNIAPEGWHVPIDAEWKQLEIYLGMSQAEADTEDWRGTDEGGKIKEAGIAHWQSPNVGATDEFGFMALPGGFRNNLGSFDGIGSITAIWALTPDDVIMSYYRMLHFEYSEICRFYYYKAAGFSVRCVKD